MIDYWSWWQGGLALGGITILFRLLLQRPLGVSGSWRMLAGSFQEIKTEQEAGRLAQDTHAMHGALFQATLEQFGEKAAQELIASTPAGERDIYPKQVPVKPGQHAVFLLCIFLGALASAWLGGNLSIDFELSETLTRLSDGLASSWVTLLLGGMMVGMGTQMAAGCTSGHGLSGCAQLSTPSLLATLIFFSSAVLTAMFFAWALTL